MTYTDKQKRQKKKNLNSVSALLIEENLPISSSLRREIEKRLRRLSK